LIDNVDNPTDGVRRRRAARGVAAARFGAQLPDERRKSVEVEIVRGATW
jgi:hypothetical protein